MADMELVLDGVKEKLLANLGAVAQQIDEEKNDEVVIEVPDEESVFISTRAELPYPCIMVLPDTAQAITDTGAQVLSDDFVRVAMWVAEANEEVLARKLIRTLSAVKKALLPGRDVPGGYGIYWLNDDYGMVFRPEPTGHFVQSVSAVFKVKQNTPV